MTVVETLKKITEKATGWARPGQDALGKLIRARKPQTYRFQGRWHHPQSSALAAGDLSRRGSPR
jgi:hypothetical protein